MSFSHLQRAPRSKREYREMLGEWDRLSSQASDAKRRANANGTDSQVRPYLDKMQAVNSARSNWLDSYDHTFNRLPE